MQERKAIGVIGIVLVLAGAGVAAAVPARPVVGPAASSLAVNAGATAQIVMTVVATPAASLTWEVSEDLGTTWTAVNDGGVYSGATTATLTITPASATMSGQQYRLVATNSDGTTQSTAVDLLVADTYSFAVIAGRHGAAGAADGVGDVARFRDPRGLAVDAAGVVFVADTGNHVIRRIATDGTVTTIAGSAGVAGSVDATGGAASFNSPNGVALAVDGTLYVADTGNHTIRRISPAGVVTTLAGLAGSTGSTDGVGDAARFHAPSDVAVLSDGAVLVSDTTNRTIRKVTPSGLVSTVAGTPGVAGTADGLGAAARFKGPAGIAVDGAGRLVIADGDPASGALRRLDVDGTVTTLVSSATSVRADGPAGRAGLVPRDVAVASNSDVFFTEVVFGHGSRVRRWSGGRVQTVAGHWMGSMDGPGVLARFDGPRGLAIDPTGALLVADGPGDYFGLYPGESQTIRRGTAGVVAPPASCPVTVPSPTIDVPQFGSGFLTIGGTRYGWALLATPGCQWSASSSDFRFVPDAGYGSGLVSLVVGSNPGGPRTLTGTLAGVPVTVRQAGDCRISLSEPYRSYRWDGGTDTIAGSITAGCAQEWSLSSSAEWMTLTGPTSGTGPITSTFQVAALPSGVDRYGTITVRSQTGETNSVTVTQTAPRLIVSRTSLSFFRTRNAMSGVVTATPSQTVQVTWEGPAAPRWTASVRPGLEPSPVPRVSATQGEGSQTVVIDIADPSALPDRCCANYSRVEFSAAGFTSAFVFVNAQNLDGYAQMAGRIDTPRAGTHTGSVPVTGWAVDGIGIDRVDVYRTCIDAIDRSRGVCRAPEPGGSDGYVFVGTATFVRGARSDIAQTYSSYPHHDRAGWGLLVLTNEFPHVPSGRTRGGQGTFTLHAWAVTVDGRTRQLDGATTVTLANDQAAAPFGAIDTPAQGDTVGGTVDNFGWVLTPDPGTGVLVPTDGSTIRVFIDGAPVGSPQFNLCRGTVGTTPAAGVLCDDDVSTLFRVDGTRFRNLDAGRGPIGLRSIPTEGLTNGLHTIAWGVTDSANRAAGIGSRYFNVANPTNDGCGAACAVRRADQNFRTSELRNLGTSIYARTGFDLQSAFTPLALDASGVPYVRIPELGRVELQIPGVIEAVQLVNGEVRSAPIGVGINRATGTVTWAPGPGFLGSYRLAFVVQGPGSNVQGPIVDVSVVPASATVDPVRMHLDRVDQAGAMVTVHGWSLDPGAASGAGIGAVHVWARRRVQGSEPVFLGAADLGIARPDVAAAHGVEFRDAGFVFTGVLPGDGEWEITAYVWVTRTGRFEDARSVRVAVVITTLR